MRLLIIRSESARRAGSRAHNANDGCTLPPYRISLIRTRRTPPHPLVSEILQQQQQQRQQPGQALVFRHRALRLRCACRAERNALRFCVRCPHSPDRRSKVSTSTERSAAYPYRKYRSRSSAGQSCRFWWPRKADSTSARKSRHWKPRFAFTQSHWSSRCIRTPT